MARRRDGGRSRRLRGRARVAEAAGLLALAGAAQRWVPMVRWSALLGQHQGVPDSWLDRPITALPVRAASPTESRVAGAIRRGSRRLPWEPTCLAQATAGQIMLRRRGEPGVVVIGLRPVQVDGVTDWQAHAWLLGRQGALTGGPAATGFTATTVFIQPDGLRATEVELSDQT